MQPDRSAPRALLIMGQQAGRTYHNQPEHWACLAEDMRLTELASCCITDDLRSLAPGCLANFDVILNYSTRIEPTEAQVDALLDAVRGGTGYVGLHAATATFLNVPRMLELLGAQLNGHPPLRRFTVRFADGDHPITRGLDDYAHEDELYHLTGDLADPTHVTPVVGVTVLAEAEGHPMVYVKQYGQGRVAYLASGHDRRSLLHPTYQEMLSRAIRWAAR